MMYRVFLTLLAGKAAGFSSMPDPDPDPERSICDLTVWDPSEAECESFVASHACTDTYGTLCPGQNLSLPEGADGYPGLVPVGATLSQGCQVACGVSPDEGSCLPVNHLYDELGEITCDCVGPDNPYLGSGQCVPEPSCGESCLWTCWTIQNYCLDHEGHSEEECLESMSMMTFPFAQAADADHFDCDVACTGR